VPQTNFDFTAGLFFKEHPDCTRVPEAVNQVDISEPFGTKCHPKIFFTNTIDAVSCK